jgi:hypothetical protein
MVLTCLLGSTIVNKIGYKWALVLGAAGYAPYAGGLVLNLNTGATWLVFVGSVTCGLSAGLVRRSSFSFSSGSTDSLNAGSFGPSKELLSWVVRFLPSSSSPPFPSLILLPLVDPEAHKRGRYLAYWLGFRNAGQILGGIISLALNAKRSTAGSIGRSNYYIFIALRKLHFYLIPTRTLTILPIGRGVRTLRRNLSLECALLSFHLLTSTLTSLDRPFEGSTQGWNACRHGEAHRLLRRDEGNLAARQAP